MGLAILHNKKFEGVEKFTLNFNIFWLRACYSHYKKVCIQYSAIVSVIHKLNEAMPLFVLYILQEQVRKCAHKVTSLKRSLCY
jgi:hypothetical protein